MTTLLNASKNQKLRVVKVSGGRGVHHNLARLQLGVGSVITVRKNAPFSGPLLVEQNGMRTALGRGIAGKIFVEKAE